MAQRFAYVDVHFFHKNTAAVLLNELGPGGPLMWLALICQGKNHRPAGEFTWTSEADAFQQLFGHTILPGDLDFTFSDFLKITGRLKQTRVAKTDRRRRGRVANVALTRWDQWQKESRKWSERERKSRKRVETTADTERNKNGSAADNERTHPPSSSRTSSTPLPPREKGTNPRAKGQSPRQRERPHPHECPHCGARQRNQPELEDHIRYVHYDHATQQHAALLDDDIPS